MPRGIGCCASTGWPLTTTERSLRPSISSARSTASVSKTTGAVVCLFVIVAFGCLSVSLVHHASFLFIPSLHFAPIAQRRFQTLGRVGVPCTALAVASTDPLVVMAAFADNTLRLFDTGALFSNSPFLFVLHCSQHTCNCTEQGERKKIFCEHKASIHHINVHPTENLALTTSGTFDCCFCAIRAFSLIFPFLCLAVLKLRKGIIPQSGAQRRWA